MDCYECAKAGSARAAVALCQKCGAGLCLEHLREAVSWIGPGGTMSVTCPHKVWDPAAVSAAARAQTSADAP